MAFEELKENTEDIQDLVQEYIENNLAYYKLRSFKAVMKSTTAIFKFTMIILCFCMVLLFCSFALAFAIGSYCDNTSYGFLAVGGIYLVLTVILFLVKDKIVERPILEKFSEIFFNN